MNHDGMNKEAPACHHCAPSKPSLDKKLIISVLALAAVYALSFFPFTGSLQESFISYFSMIWWAVVLGLFIGGLIDHFVPDGFIYKYLGDKSGKSIFFAVIAGFLLSACSHGILAISMQLHKKGARISSVITFLLAAPWANFPVTILLFTFFGPQAFLFIGGAMAIAITTGFIFNGLEKLGWIEASPKGNEGEPYTWDTLVHFNVKESVKGVGLGALNLANMVLWWINIGFLAAVLIKAYVPSHIFMDYFGPDFTGLLLTLAAATVIEVCSEGSSPIAFEIFNKVGTLGNPFVFLMAGVVTDYTEIGLIWTNIGKKTALWLPIVTVPQVLALAIWFNTL